MEITGNKDGKERGCADHVNVSETHSMVGAIEGREGNKVIAGHLVGGLSNNSANISLSRITVACACVRLSHIDQSKYTQRLNNQHDSLKSFSKLLWLKTARRQND